MTTLALALGTLVLYLVAYHTYGRWLARRVFRLDPAAPVPSIEQRDDVDFVPTRKSVVFGHHFTSIAGTGPIVGPALAVIWGWVPALLWVVFGSILIGAVHDFGALVVSLRNRGQTVGDIAGRVLAPRTRVLFLGILFLALAIVLAIFGLVIAGVFRMFPAAIFPCVFQVPLAMAIGAWLHRRGADLLLPSLLALALMYVSVALGDVGLLGDLNLWLSKLPVLTWVAVLLVYSYAASVLPVWALLQPRDYINSLQLLSAVALVVVGLAVAAVAGGAGGRELELVAPAFRSAPEGAPWIFPFLFITIACGAISGFHCLVSSGTSSKQLRCETDAQFVGYGSMLTEGFLATLVILACVAGIGLGVKGADGAMVFGQAAYMERYATWKTADGLVPAVGSFVEGSANFLTALGLPSAFAVALMGVFVASFAGTTMDTACRLQRYVTQELAATLKLAPLTNKHAATTTAVVLAFAVACIPAPGRAPGSGGMNLWPLFGATNQLLAGLSFLVILFWLHRRKLPIWFAVIPATAMLVLPGLALGLEIFKENGWLAKGDFTLVSFGLAILAFEVWMIAEALLAWPRIRGVLEPPPLAPPSRPAHGQALAAGGGRSC
jgi:carbon starvation protein